MKRHYLEHLVCSRASNQQQSDMGLSGWVGGGGISADAFVTWTTCSSSSSPSLELPFFFTAHYQSHPEIGGERGRDWGREREGTGWRWRCSSQRLSRLRRGAPVAEQAPVAKTTRRPAQSSYDGRGVPLFFFYLGTQRGGYFIRVRWLRVRSAALL